MDVSIPRALAPLLLLLGPPLASGAEEPPEKPATPAEELQALVKEFFEAARIYSYTGTTDEERTPVLARVEKLQPRLLQLAAKNPRDPVALDALVQAVTLELWFENNTTHPCWGEDSPGRKAIALLLRDHIRDDKLGEACRRMAYGFSRECEGFLRAALEMNPHQEVQALACLRLAQCLHARQQKLDLIREQPEMRNRNSTKSAICPPARRPGKSKARTRTASDSS